MLSAGYDIGFDCRINTGDESFDPQNTSNINTIQTSSKGRFDGSFALAGVKPFSDDLSQIIAADRSQQITSGGFVKNAKLGLVYIGDESLGVYGLFAATEVGKVKFTEVSASGLADFQMGASWL